MKRITISAVFFIIALLVSAETGGTAQDPINFDLTLKDIYTMVQEGNANNINPDRYLVINGTVSAREVLNPDKENFVGILELSSGEWLGVADVEIYRCYIQLEGSEFSSAIPVRRSRRPKPEEIQLNTKILVLGKYLGYSEDEQGNKYPVIKGFKIRKVE
ncbi:MAG: hypothetical protein DRP59_01720 [Spirochaetes bacterium]|nr:MAG: hypothetical protein DRP59_01720 [Spirochaetota bacterium]